MRIFNKTCCAYIASICKISYADSFSNKNTGSTLEMLSELISAVLSNSHRVRARTLAKISGKIIAMTPAVGFITQIMMRCMFSAL
jgi:hypothetical protein